MGANEDFAIFYAPNAKAALREAARVMSAKRSEYGDNGYAGHLGICPGVRVQRRDTSLVTRGHRSVPRPLPTKEQAQDLLFGQYNKAGEEVADGIAEKYGPAILIQIKNTGAGSRRRWLLGAMCAS